MEFTDVLLAVLVGCVVVVTLCLVAIVVGQLTGVVTFA